MATVVTDHAIRNAAEMAAWIGIDGAFMDVGYWTTAVSIHFGGTGSSPNFCFLSMQTEFSQRLMVHDQSMQGF